MGCGERPPCGSRGGGPVSRPFARASASLREKERSYRSKAANMKMRRFKKGFTLAELLIFIAIIAVLVAISIPIFSSQLEKSRRAVDLHTARAIESVLANAVNDGILAGDGKAVIVHQMLLHFFHEVAIQM